MAHNHHCHFVHKHTQLLPDLEFRYRKALPHGFNSFQQPPERVPAAWEAEGGEPSQFDHTPQPLYRPDRYSRRTIPRTAEAARGKEIHAKLDYLLAAFDKWDATDRRIGRLYAPPRRPNTRYPGSFHDQPHPRTIANNWDQVGWDDRRDHRQRHGFEEYPRRHQPLHNSRAEQPTYRSDRLLSHGTAPLPADAPPRSSFTHRPQQSNKSIDLGKQRGLPNTPDLMGRSPCPAQLAAVSDYNEKLRIYRLKQASLLAELNATFEENIDAENLVEDVPNNAAHNGGANLDVDVPIDESLEEIFMTDNMPRQVLVGAYDEKIDDLSVPTHKELEMREDTETLLEKENKAEALRSSLEPTEKDFSVLMEKPSERESMENQSLVNDIQAGFVMKKQDNQEEMEEKRRLFEDELKLKAEELGKTGDAHSGSHALACVYVDLNVGDVPSMNHRSTSLDTDARLIPPCNDTPCLSIVGGVNRLFIAARNFGGHIRSPWLIFYGGDRGIHSTIRYVFDPGGDASPKLLLTTIVVAS